MIKTKRARRRGAAALGFATALCLPALAAPAPATGAPAGVGLPWKHTRTGGIASVAPDTTALGSAVATACTGSGRIYGTDVATWTAPRDARVVAEQRTSIEINGDVVDLPGGLAVVATDGTVLACLTARGLDASPVLTLAKGTTVRLVQFLQASEPDSLDFEWTQTTLLTPAPGKAPLNVTPASAQPISKLPTHLQVDLRLAPIRPRDPAAEVPACPGSDDAFLLVDRALWFRFTPASSTTVLAATVGPAAVALAEQTSTGPRWLPGACAGGTALAAVEAGHTYLVAVGHLYDSTDGDLLDVLAPTTLSLRKSTPNRPGLSVGAGTLTPEGDQLTGLIVCPEGATFTVHGRISETWAAGGATTVDGFGSFVTACRGRTQPWTAYAGLSHVHPSEILTVAEVRNPRGVTTLVGPVFTPLG